MIGWWLGLLTASIVAALAWAYLFYVPHALWASTVALGLAFVLTVPLVIIAWRTQWWAGVVLLPYVAWLGIATSLAAGYAPTARAGVSSPRSAGRRGRSRRRSPEQK